MVYMLISGWCFGTWGISENPNTWEFPENPNMVIFLTFQKHLGISENPN